VDARRGGGDSIGRLLAAPAARSRVSCRLAPLGAGSAAVGYRWVRYGPDLPLVNPLRVPSSGWPTASSTRRFKGLRGARRKPGPVLFAPSLKRADGFPHLVQHLRKGTEMAETMSTQARRPLPCSRATRAFSRIIVYGLYLVGWPCLHLPTWPGSSSLTSNVVKCAARSGNRISRTDRNVLGFTGPVHRRHPALLCGDWRSDPDRYGDLVLYRTIKGPCGRSKTSPTTNSGSLRNAGIAPSCVCG